MCYRLCLRCHTGRGAERRSVRPSPYPFFFDKKLLTDLLSYVDSLEARVSALEPELRALNKISSVLNEGWRDGHARDSHVLGSLTCV